MFYMCVCMYVYKQHMYTSSIIHCLALKWNTGLVYLRLGIHPATRNLLNSVYCYVTVPYNLHYDLKDVLYPVTMVTYYRYHGYIQFWCSCTKLFTQFPWLSKLFVRACYGPLHPDSQPPLFRVWWHLAYAAPGPYLATLSWEPHTLSSIYDSLILRTVPAFQVGTHIPEGQHSHSEYHVLKHEVMTRQSKYDIFSSKTYDLVIYTTRILS